MKYSIDDRFWYGPNIDVVIRNKPGARYNVFAVECKFTETYGGREHAGLKEIYLQLDIWEKIPGLRKLAQEICPKDNRFEFLHAAQLTKHILRLSRAYGKTGFRLLYLWYDTLGREGGKHREEVEEFLEIANNDSVKVHTLSYQNPSNPRYLLTKRGKGYMLNGS